MSAIDMYNRRKVSSPTPRFYNTISVLITQGVERRRLDAMDERFRIVDLVKCYSF